MGSIMKGKGNPAGKDMSIAGKIRGAMGLMSREKLLVVENQEEWAEVKRNRCQLTLNSRFDLSIDDIAEEAFERCGLKS